MFEGNVCEGYPRWIARGGMLERNIRGGMSKGKCPREECPRGMSEENVNGVMSEEKCPRGMSEKRYRTE